MEIIFFFFTPTQEQAELEARAEEIAFLLSVLPGPPAHPS